MAANKDLLLGKIAVGKGYCTEEQVRKAIALQTANPDGLPLGQILLREGFLTPDQHSEILALQRRAFGMVDPVLKKDHGAILFGKLAVREGLVTEEDVNECLRLQGKAGEKRTLGEVMVERGFLSGAQVKALLAKQQKKIMSCTSCRLSFTVMTIAQGKSVACPRCKRQLEEGKPSDSVRTDAEFATTIVRAIRAKTPGPSVTTPASMEGKLRLTCPICERPFVGTLDATGRSNCPHCHAGFSI